MSYVGPFPVEPKQGGTGDTTLTNNGVLIGKGTNPVSSLVAALNGQLVIGNTGNAPSVAGLASAGGTILITNGAGTINLDVASSPSSPGSFLWYLHTSLSNVTGDATIYKVIFDTKFFDTSSSFNGGTFTAPANGIYCFGYALLASNLAVGHTDAEITINATGVFPGDGASTTIMNPYAASASGLLVMTGTVIVPLLATQYVYLTIQVEGSTLTVGLDGTANTNTMGTYFYGYMIS